ncbi:hypothetical protein GCM10009808_02530 [Microbacterium sediminicola]|uniref:LGFP repeat-containing protein n=1 Tax=Microbacterium sediminicola TaxID=415210 RepID=A0ABP4TJA9_9MICO
MLSSVFLALAVLVAPSVATAAETSTSESTTALDLSAASSVVKTADLSQFDAGNIISDTVFFNSGTMTEAQIQTFLESKVSSCASGYTCLKDYYVDTRSISADAMCNAYSGGGRERASRVIYKVSQACGINPQVILVMLQKEQGLVTTSRPSAWNYQAAMGQGCPDTAACDSQYYGLFNQVYGGAWQLKRYANPPGTSNYFTWYAPGHTWNILYNPNSACGRGAVYVENQATANLYYYTPYQPNAAALAAGYGLGDSCSSYGNRNFFNYFTDWFGSTQSTGGVTYITAKHEALGGDSGWLGSATSEVHCGLVDAGCYQDFENGKIHWSPSTGAYATNGGIQAAWGLADWENGYLGYPTSDEHCSLINSGCYQDFEGGKIYWTGPTGAHPVSSPLLAGWGSIGYEKSWLGYPTGEQVCTGDEQLCEQTFQNGVMVWTPGSGARASTADIVDAWQNLGGDSGKLGAISAGAGCGLPDGGCYQEFKGGKIHWSAASGAHATWGGIQTAWARSGWERGPLGYPIAEEECGLASLGCSQQFQNGTMYWSAPTDAHYLMSGMADGYEVIGGPSSNLGYPTLEEGCGLPNGGCYQVFQGGLMHWQPDTGAYATWGGIGTAWAKLGSERGVLGYPVGSEECGLVDDGCSQEFENGVIYWTAATDARAVYGDLLTAYIDAGGPDGSLGYPTANPVCVDGTCTQDFEYGTLP